jgi:glycosyltransferase involved in cell wall biosynthesis
MIDSSRPRTVAILQESVEGYRLRFFDELHRLLSRAGIEMTLWVHETGIPDRSKSIPYLRALRCLGRGRFSWARVPMEVSEADLVVQPQQVRHLAFLACLLRRRSRGKANAFWGHGKCFDPRFENRMSERLKRWFSVRVDWWFAYNALSARLVEALGFPKEKITPVMNSTDTVALRKKHLEIKSEGIDRVRAALGIGPGPVGLFLGRLYFNKRVDFTLRAAMEIRKRVPTFELIVIGDGEDRGMVVDAAARNSWIHYPGPKGDTEKVPYMAVADVLLNPGVVGLVINDAMAMGLPTLTTDFPTHSPEIDYLEDGVTGLISRPWQDLPPYVEMAVALLSEPDRLSIMKETSRAAGEAFSAETMAGNFAGGILPALESTLSKSP